MRTAFQKGVADMRSVFPFILFAAVAGCSQDIVSPEGETPRQLSFHFWEMQSGIWFLRVETADAVYGCVNYQLHGTVVRTGDIVEVTAPGTVDPPDVCLTAIGPAVLRAPAELSPGEYELVFHNAGRTDRYALSVSDTAYTVHPLMQRFTQPTSSRFPMGPH
jgi:hypothetical protein